MNQKYKRFEKYYLNIDLSKIDYNTSEYVGLVFSNVQYRLDGGAWRTLTGTDYLVYLTPEIYELINNTPTNNISLPSTYSRLEILGTLFSDGNALNYDKVNIKYLQSVTISNPHEIELDVLNCEDKVVNKTSGTNLLLVDKIIGSIRDEINLLNPSILIQYNKVPDFNYVYIPSFQRYYFVTNITCVRNNIYRVDLKVDVLTSFATDIYKQDGYVLRYENSGANGFVDDRRPLNNTFQNGFYECSNYRTTANAVNCTFNVSDSSGYNFVVSHLGEASYSGTGIPSPTNATYLPAQAIHSSGVLVGCVQFNDMVKIQNAVYKDATKQSFFVSLISYPFDVSATTYYSTTSIQVSMQPKYVIDSSTLEFVDISQSSGRTLINARYIRNFASNYIIVEDFMIYAPNGSGVKNYLDYEPYSNIELYVPFVGWVKLNCRDVWNQRILVYYGLDITSGFATAYVYNYDQKSIIYSGSCQIGTKIPMSTTNAYENERQKQNNVSNLALGIIGSGVSVGIGAVTGQPLGIIGGVLSVANTIKSYTNAENLIYDKGQVMFTSSETAYYSPQNKVWLKRVYHSEISITESVYKRLNGYPYKNYESLTSLTGYAEIPDLHYKPSTQTYITKTEIDEIISLARDGIIL